MPSTHSPPRLLDASNVWLEHRQLSALTNPVGEGAAVAAAAAASAPADLDAWARLKEKLGVGMALQ